jgi:hypothetical protein
MKKGTIFLFLLLLVFSSMEYALDELTDAEVYTLFVYQSLRTYTDNWERPKKQEFEKDPSKFARLFGYALCNQIRFIKGDSAKQRIYDLLEGKIKSSIEEIAHYRGTEELSENARLEKERQAQREFLLAITGWYSDEMANLTGVHPRGAPDFFTFLEQAQQGQGEEQDPAGSDAVAGIYEVRQLNVVQPPGTLILKGNVDQVEFDYKGVKPDWHWTGTLKWDGEEDHQQKVLAGQCSYTWEGETHTYTALLKIREGTDGKWRAVAFELVGSHFILKKTR